MGRPSEYSDSLATEIVDWIAEGKTLREFCRQDGRPHYLTVYDWLDKDESFSQRFARARLVGEEVIHQECLEIADTPKSGAIVTDKDGVIETKTADMLEHRKLQIYTRLQLLAKWNPKKYGDKVQQEVTGANGGPVEFVTKSILEE